MKYTRGALGIKDRHNERKNSDYRNQDIIAERSDLNVHFKYCGTTYAQAFDKLLADGVISTRYLGKDPNIVDELIFDINTEYFERRGGYEFAKQFYTEAYKLAVKIAGSEDYILSAVMHADEINKSVSELLGRPAFHFHLHIVYIPVVDKEVKWTKRCKDPALVGKTREVIHQVSHSKKWPRITQTDAQGNPVLTSKGKPVFINSYSLLQDAFYQHMKAAGFTDFERGERGSTVKHLDDLDFKIQKDRERSDALTDAIKIKAEQHEELENIIQDKEDAAASLDEKMKKQKQQISYLDSKLGIMKNAESVLDSIEGMGRETILGKIVLTPDEWQTVHKLAREGFRLKNEILSLKSDVETAKRRALSADHDKDYYKSKLKTLSEDTEIFQQAVNIAPREVIGFLNQVIDWNKQRETQRQQQADRDDYDYSL